MAAADYTEADIKSLDWREHIRMRPGMYIGKLGDGSSPDDGRVEVRDFGRGIPLGKLFDCATQINTGAKYDSEAFKKSVGLNGGQRAFRA